MGRAPSSGRRAGTHGRKPGKPLIRPAVIPPTYEVPTHPVITLALGSLGIPAINDVIKTGQGIAFVTDVHRDGEGWASTWTSLMASPRA